MTEISRSSLPHAAVAQHNAVNVKEGISQVRSKRYNSSKKVGVPHRSLTQKPIQLTSFEVLTMFHARLSLVAIFDEEVVDHPQHKAELEAEEEVKAQPMKS